MSLLRKLVIVVVSVFLLLAGCKNGEDPPAGPKGQGKGSEAPGLNVVVSKVETRDVAYQVKTLGSIEPEESVQVTAQVSGVVSHVAFEAGDHISQDTILLQIDPDRYQLELERAQAEYRRAVADWRRVDEEMKRRERLAKDGLVSNEELFGARQESERLEAVAASSKAAMDLAEQNFQRCQVRSPRAGTINTRSVDTGQFVQTGNVLATLINTARLRLRFKVSDAESMHVAKGQIVNFKVSSLGEQDFPAQVYYVGAVADAATRQVEVLAWVKNPGPLKPGFFAEVTLNTESHKNALVVPESAVQASERGFVVYVVDSGHASQRPVQIGLRTGNGMVEILSGIKSGDTVVREGSDRLSDGVAVQPVAPTEKAEHP